MGRVLVLVLMAVLLASPAFAAFNNGDFETGDFTGWTKNGGYWSGGAHSYSGDPGKSAIVAPGLDYLTNNNLNMVYSGKYSARVNNFDWDYHFSTISQTVTWNDPSIYFAWAAVLEEPSNPHGSSNAPHFSITLHDDTANVNLYSTSFDVYNPAPGLTWKKGLHGGPNDSGSDWWYNDWYVVQLDTSGAIGHNLTLSLLASDCAWGGHGGYAYLDGFGEAPPPPGVPEPSTFILVGAGLVGLGFARKLIRK
jgi:hypothetical protein